MKETALWFLWQVDRLDSIILFGMYEVIICSLVLQKDIYGNKIYIDERIIGV